MKNTFLHSRKVWGICLIMLSLVSCAPAVTVEYYRPIVVRGEVVNAHCPPVYSFVLFEENDIIIGAHVAFSEKGQLSSTITFEVPKDKIVRLLDHDIWFDTPSHGLSKVKLSGYIWTGPGRTSNFSPETPLRGETKKKLFFKQITSYGTTQNAYFVFYASIDMFKPEQVTIKIPRFSVDNVVVELPEIKFKLSSKYFPIYPANC